MRWLARGGVAVMMWLVATAALVATLSESPAQVSAKEVGGWEWGGPP
ncbi:MAG: hypothetical protein ACRCYQ_12510 [Nocardioides sp.]